MKNERPSSPTDIVALTEPRDLLVEGLRQHNCVASYAPAVARGDTYVYRVLAPERATLAIRAGPVRLPGRVAGSHPERAICR